MSHALALLGRSRVLAAALLSAILTLTVVGLVSATTANAGGSASPDVAAPPAVPTSASQIQNLDQVKTAIKGYYGDTPTVETDPVTGAITTLHEPSATGNYAKEVKGIEAGAKTYLAHEAGNAEATRKPAIVLDIDDTSLVTYNYEIYTNFVYNPVTNADFVNTAAFPKVFGMPNLVQTAKAEGYSIFFLTGRPESQRPGTTTNLTKVGFPKVPTSHLILKDLTNPIYSSCYNPTPTPASPTCTTTQYKSLTRQYIESLGYKIYANFGDQFSDLAGGYALKTFKMPNPMYYLP